MKVKKGEVVFYWIIKRNKRNLIRLQLVHDEIMEIRKRTLTMRRDGMVRDEDITWEQLALD